MTDGPLVDLLLVRLTRDEEKEKVRGFLVSELGMSDEEARKTVESTPAMLNEPLPMELARGIQEVMYPFIDLLPRQYGQHHDAEPAVEQEKDQDQEIVFEENEIDDSLFSGPDPEVEISDDDFANDLPDPPDNGAVKDHGQESPEIIDVASFTSSPEPDSDESFVITSASDEMINVARCHVCGRTPTSTERLAPCRTCGKPTCGDCFDRIVHVCDKCAAEGRMVDRPLKGAPEYRRDAIAEQEIETTPVKSHPSFRISPALLTIGVLVIGAALFLLLDPLGLLGGSTELDESQVVAVFDSTGAEVLPDSLGTDTLVAVVSDSAAIVTPDTLVQVKDTATVAVDSLAINDLSVDSTLVIEEDTVAVVSSSSVVLSIPDSLLRPLRDIQLPDGIEPPDEMISPLLYFSSPVPGIEVLTDSLGHLSFPLGCLSTECDIETDGISLIRTDTGSDVLVISILHPEPLEQRTAFISGLGQLLDSTTVDQIVMYYLQSDYHPYEIFTFVSGSFGTLGESGSPGFILSKQGVVENTWVILSGAVRDWMLEQD